MKRNYLKFSLILLVLTTILPGCLDIWITTRINPDGSIGQTIVFEGDSTEIAEVPFAFMNEEGWKREWTRIDKDKNKLVVSKEFASVKEFNESMNPADTNLLTIRVNASLQRKFRWFFTRYVYEETIVKANPFGKLDHAAYFTDDDIRWIAMDEDIREKDPEYDSVRIQNLESRFEDYLLRSMYEEFHLSLLAVLDEDKTLTLKREDLDSQKETIYRFLIDSVKGEETDEILEGIGKVIAHPDLITIREKHLHRFDRFQDKMQFFSETSDDNYKFTVRMPGLLLQTNSKEISGSEIAWDIDYYEFFFRDVTLTAESRMVNSWAFIVAGIILLLSLAGLITSLIRKRKS
jgi:hypothetical protein